MRKVAVGFTLLLLMGTLGGCSLKSPLEDSQELVGVSIESGVKTEQSCREWVRERESMRWAQYAELDPSSKVYALMHQETMDMIKTTFGDGSDPCKPGTNVWDAYVAYAEQQGELSRESLRTLGGVVKHGLTVGGMAYAAGEIVGGMGDRITTGRDNTRSGAELTQANDNPITTTEIAEGD
jgi:hypothetical protein